MLYKTLLHFQVWEPSVQNWQKSDAFDRTIDLSSLGLDFNDVIIINNLTLGLFDICDSQVFDQLLSPKGIVEQFVLSIGLQVMNVGGYDAVTEPKSLSDEICRYLMTVKQCVSIAGM